MKKLQPLNPNINDISEKAFQRAIFRSEQTIRGAKTSIKWLDIELPVIINGNARRDSLDMIGVYLNGRNRGTYIICEVKFAHDDYHSDSPSKAAEELQRYLDGIGDGKELEENEIHHDNNEFDWRNVSKKCEKWILANSSYWAYWLGHLNKWSFEDDIYYCYIDTPGVTFQKQKGNKSSYIPEMPENKTLIQTIWPNPDSSK